MNRREPIAWMVYTVDGKSAYVTDNPSDIKAGQSAYALYPGPFEQLLLTDEEIAEAVREADLDWQAGWTLDEHAPNRFDTLARNIEKASWEKNHG